MKIYRFYWDAGKMGSLTGMFVVNARGEEKLRQLVGRQVYFGEALGKHSEIYGKLEASDLREVPASEADVAVVVRIFELDLSNGWASLSGYCPLNYRGEE